ncbi:O-methyltransferase [Niallia circulans]|uniref:tRNA 5-hydroxyuridine methyltransferase n=1 Tax=Niallia circulans TaxID=1397 RepID=A0A0J1IAP1_NIACI|nr:O-methyltransferase [Niallia circulans]KLV23016.1 SAM-dependent methyltransferase [Niallia circulans]MCM2980651.1 O-methyltransferase [Niallia circulans]MDR4317825.1 O-methyltransferase [Niallia circulans]MED3841610.1 O-methyltransferase [Niallia circulans]MED4243346.1 O-methyltransferase [Niallia circulans]
MQNKQILEYIENLIPERNNQISEMEQYAKQNEVPIMELIGIETLLQLLRIQQPKKILEVGTAIGYSAIRMAEALPSSQIVTLERDEQRYLVAKENVEKFKLEAQIVLLQGDALELGSIVQQYGPFDAIFIDAAKGQYQKFFDLYSPFLSNDGIVYTDNILFHGLVAAEEIDSRNLRQLVRKIRNYNQWLMGNQDYHTAILPVGDGIAISKKRG